MGNLLSDKELLEFSQQKRATAIDLLRESKVVETLSAFGSPLIIGGLALDLMIDEDIDIVVEADAPNSAAQEALNKFIDLEVAQKYEFGDFVKFERTNRPIGYIVNLRKNYGQESWEVEIWFLKNIGAYRDQLKRYESKLDKGKRLEILKRKHQRKIEHQSKYDLPSMDIYHEILVL